ncbi:hypothetical protein ACLMJK_009317 [Lecanora helva]
MANGKRYRSSRGKWENTHHNDNSISVLGHAIEQEKTYKEDAFQAQICLAWLYQTIAENNNAMLTLPEGLEQASERLAHGEGLIARWTHVCIIKGAYIKGAILEHQKKTKEALRFYESMIPYISNLSSAFANTQEFQAWAEHFFSRHCALVHRHLSSHAHDPSSLLAPSALIPPTHLLTPFRIYARGWDARNPARTTTISSALQIWKAYYNALSGFLQNGILQPMFTSKIQQGVELKRVEKTLEALLFKEYTFPRADQVNTQVETFVDEVMANWRVMYGSTWREEDLEGTGKIALGHGVLDILYRAATRTFHSTRVLRHLFTVHASLAEFFLATKAFDSYLEILLKGKARAEKSGREEIGIDDDSTALATAAAAIKMLCQYGRREDVEKSLDIAKTIETWLQKLHSSQNPVVSANDVPRDLLDKSQTATYRASGKALAIGYHALGVCYACWARMTHESSSRSQWQDKALTNFRSALMPELEEQDSVEILYSLAYVLAETRDSDGAIAVTKQALSASSTDRVENGVAAVDFAQDGTEVEAALDFNNRGLLLRLWHLLALLLSVRQDFATALASCEAALDLYGSKSILYGDVKNLNPSTLLYSEKKSIIELKITQLALSEVINGPEEAVNASGELLGLYAKLFDYVHKPKPAPKTQDTSSSPTPSVNGTLRTLRGSILGLPRDSKFRSRKPENLGQDITANSVHSYKTQEEEAQAPAISIAGYDGPPPSSSTEAPARHESRKLQKKHSRRSIGSRRIGQASSPSRPSTSASSHHHSLNVHIPLRNRHDNSSATDNSGPFSHPDSTNRTSDEVGVAITHDLPSIPSTPAATSEQQPNPLHTIPSATQNMNHRNPNPNPVPPKPPQQQQDTQPPSTTPKPSTLHPLPEPLYPPLSSDRHALTLLVKIWLVISSLYRRANMPSDASGALSEATTHIETIERSLIANSGGDGAGATLFSTLGPGGCKATDELWADMLAEKGALCVQLSDLDAANAAFEDAVGHWSDHVAATVGLCNLLLDEYTHPSTSTTTTKNPNDADLPPPYPPTLSPLPSPPTHTSLPPSTPDLLPRLAARDRAYGLLSQLTKSGQGWDNGEAWMALSRAFEVSGMAEEAVRALWWVVEVAEGRGVRGWGVVGGRV